MKNILIAAALIVGTPVLAQDVPTAPQGTPPTSAGTPETPTNPDMPTTPAEPATPATPGGPDSSAMPAMPATPATPATPPAATSTFTPTPVDSASLPRCSRTVRDRCIQTAGRQKHRR